MLRMGIRDFRRSFQGTDVIVSGPYRELWALRKTGRLTLADIAGVNRSIERLKRAVSKPHSRGRLYGITVLLTRWIIGIARANQARSLRKRKGREQRANEQGHAARHPACVSDL
jgi:hypothetical protein